MFYATKIPSWTITITGATIVIVATAVSVIWLYQSHTEILRASSKIADNRIEIDSLRNNQSQSNQKIMDFGTFLASTHELTSETSSSLDRETRVALQGIAHSIWDVPREWNLETQLKEFDAATEEISSLNLGEYNFLQLELERLRRDSVSEDDSKIEK